MKVNYEQFGIYFTKEQAFKSGLFINEGSVWDIQIHLKNSIKRYSIKELYEEYAREEVTRNRSTVKKLIEAQIKRLEKIGAKKEVSHES